MARPIAPLSVALALLAAPAALAEEGPKNTITLLPVAHELGMYGIEWERAAGPMTFYFAPGLRNPLDRNEPLTVGLDVGLRFFAFSPAPGGFFVGPQVSGEYIHGPLLASSPAITVSGGLKAGALMGYTLLINNIGVVSVAVGGEYFRFYEYSNGAITQVGEDLGIVLRGALGFAF